MPLRATNLTTIDTPLFYELCSNQTRLYHDLYRVCEALIQIPNIERRFGFLRGTTAEAQRNLLAQVLDLQEALRRNEWAIQAAAMNQVT